MKNKWFNLIGIAFKLFKKRVNIYILLLMQMVFSIEILIGVIGEIQVVNDSKRIVSTVNNAKHAYLLGPFIIYNRNEGASNTEWKDDIRNIKGIKSIGEYGRNAYYIGDRCLQSIEYGDLIINMLNIKLSSGKWFDESELFNKENYIPAIMVGEQYKVGELLNLERMDENSFKIKVIGTISNDEYVLNLSAGGTDVSYKTFVQPCGADIILPFDHVPIYGNDIDSNTMGTSLFIETEDDISSEEIKGMLNSYGCVLSVQELKTNYSNELNEYFKEYGIVLVVFMIISAVGIAGINGIINSTNKKRYSIYFILGLSRNECAFIEGVRSGMFLVITFLVSVIVSTKTSFLESMDPNINLNIQSFLCVFIYIVLLYLLTSLYFVRKISKSNLIEIYRHSK